MANVDDAQLSEVERRHILKEELLRRSIRRELDGLEEKPKPKPRVWTFLNSSFGLFLLSSVLIGGLSKAYTDYQQGVQEEATRTSELLKLSTEINVRVTQLTALLRELADNRLTPAKREDKTIFIWRIIVGDERYVPSLPEFKGNHFSGLVSRLKLYGFSDGADAAILAAVSIENDARRAGYVLQHKDLVGNIRKLEHLNKELLDRLSRGED